MLEFHVALVLWLFSSQVHALHDHLFTFRAYCPMIEYQRQLFGGISLFFHTLTTYFDYFEKVFWQHVSYCLVQNFDMVELFHGNHIRSWYFGHLAVDGPMKQAFSLHRPRRSACFLEIVSLVFSIFCSAIRSSHEFVCDRAIFFGKKNCPKNEPK